MPAILPCSLSLAWIHGDAVSPLMRAEACATAVAEWCLLSAAVPRDATVEACIARLPRSLYAGYTHRLAQVRELLTYFLLQMVARDLVPARVTTQEEFNDYVMRFVCPELSRYGVTTLEERTHSLYRRIVLSEDDDDLDMDETFIVVSAYDPRLYTGDVDGMLLVYDSVEYCTRHAVLNSMVDAAVASVLGVIAQAFDSFVFTAVRDVRPALSSLTRASPSSILSAVSGRVSDTCSGGAVLRLLLGELRTSVNDPAAAGVRLAGTLLAALNHAPLEPLKTPQLVNQHVIGDLTRATAGQALVRVAELFDVQVDDLGAVAHFIVESPICLVTLATRMLSVDFVPARQGAMTLSTERAMKAWRASHVAVQAALDLTRVLRVAAQTQIQTPMPTLSPIPSPSQTQTPSQRIPVVALHNVVPGLTPTQARVAVSEAVTLLCHTLAMCSEVQITTHSLRSVMQTALTLPGVLLHHADGSVEASLVPVFEHLCHSSAVKRYKAASGSLRRSRSSRYIASPYARPEVGSATRMLPLDHAVTADRFGLRAALSDFSHERSYTACIEAGVVPEAAAVFMLPTLADVVGTEHIDLCVYTLIFNLASCVAASLTVTCPALYGGNCGRRDATPSCSVEDTPRPQKPVTRKRARTTACASAEGFSGIEASVTATATAAAAATATATATILQTCVVCYDACTTEGGAAHGTSCGHVTCVPCCMQGVRCGIEDAFNGETTDRPDPFACVVPGCKARLDEDCVRRLLSPLQLAMLGHHHVKLRREAAALVPGTDTCTACGAVYPTDTTSCVLTCPVCNCPTCRRCGDAAHPGIVCTAALLTTSPTWVGISPSDLLSECSDVVPCPTCKTPFSKVDGCNHMTCDRRVPGTTARCGTHFCYTCGERVEIRPGLLMQHYSGGRCSHDIGARAIGVTANRMRTVHALHHAAESGISPVTRQAVSSAIVASALALLDRKL